MKLVKAIFKLVGLGITRADTLEMLLKKNYGHDLLNASVERLLKLQTLTDRNLWDLYGKSSSDLSQDLFSLIVNQFKTSGFFIEIGAGDGFSGSNTLMLEECFEWKGILVEPIKQHQGSIRRRKAKVSDKLVFSESGRFLDFLQTDQSGLSTIQGFENNDLHAKSRKVINRDVIESISLHDLLEFYCAPQTIDFLSVDTEGSEFEILSVFDFSRTKFNCITVEHNFNSELRVALQHLLIENGYHRVLLGISYVDDWYVHSDVLEVLPPYLRNTYQT